MLNRPKTSIAWPWLDRRGRLSPLKLAVLLGLIAPALVLSTQWASGDLMPRPLNAVIHGTGLWGMRFLLLSLCLTPLRQGFAFADLVLVRRMVGVGAFAWLATHFGLYIIDQAFDVPLIVAEILKRFYLTLGFIALVGLLLLASTSTDGMVRRLGARRWRALHRLVYGIAVLGLVHFFMQSKADPGEATIAAGLYFWAMSRRYLTGGGLAMVLPMIAIAAVAAALSEAAFLLALRGVDPLLVLAANLDVAYGLRPAPIAGLIVAGVELAALVRRRLRQRRAARPGPDAPRPGVPRSAETAT